MRERIIPEDLALPDDRDNPIYTLNGELRRDSRDGGWGFGLARLYDYPDMVMYLPPF